MVLCDGRVVEVRKDEGVEELVGQLEVLKVEEGKEGEKKKEEVAVKEEVEGKGALPDSLAKLTLGQLPTTIVALSSSDQTQLRTFLSSILSTISQPPQRQSNASIVRLLEMGFALKDIEKALEESGGNEGGAVEKLLGGA